MIGKGLKRIGFSLLLIAVSSPPLFGRTSTQVFPRGGTYEDSVTVHIRCSNRPGFVKIRKDGNPIYSPRGSSSFLNKEERFNDQMAAVCWKTRRTSRWASCGWRKSCPVIAIESNPLRIRENTTLQLVRVDEHTRRRCYRSFFFKRCFSSTTYRFGKVAKVDFRIQHPKPQLSQPKTADLPATVTLSNIREGATIHYAFDGLTPTEASPSTSNSIYLWHSKHQSVTVRVFHPRLEPSDAVTFAFSASGKRQKDSNNNAIDDAWELHYFGRLGVDPDADDDNDGLTNLQEYQFGYLPGFSNREDLDNDGLYDAWETVHFGNLANQSGYDDFDKDGSSNFAELHRFTDPSDAKDYELPKLEFQYDALGRLVQTNVIQ